MAHGAGFLYYGPAQVLVSRITGHLAYRQSISPASAFIKHLDYLERAVI